MSGRIIAPGALALVLASGGCGAPRPVRDLAAVTAPFVVATHASMPGVERAFAAQTTRTSGELALYDNRRRTAERQVAGTELLWSLRQTAPDRRSISLMERIRRNDGMLRDPAPATAAPTLLRVRADADISQITRVTELLKTVATSRRFDPTAAIRFGEATWRQLKALDAAAVADAADKDGTEPQ